MSYLPNISSILPNDLSFSMKKFCGTVFYNYLCDRKTLTTMYATKLMITTSRKWMRSIAAVTFAFLITTTDAQNPAPTTPPAIETTETQDSVTREDLQKQQVIIDRQNDSLRKMELDRLKMEMAVHEREQAITEKKNLYITIGSIVFILVLIATIILNRIRMKRLRQLNSDLADAHHEVELALQVKHKFLNNVSHGMRTPLTSITGFADVLIEGNGTLTHHDTDKIYRLIKDNSLHLEHIINNLIELSTYETKSSLPKNDIVDPIEMTQQLIKEMQPQAHHAVRLTAQCNLPNNYTLRTDQTALKKILTHLLDNALKFTEHGRVELRTSLSGQKIIFSVTDTGTGLSDERQKVLFEPFAETQDNVQTMGVGLSICRSIARLLGGEIRLDTNYLHGCRFIVELPDD